MHIIIIIIIIYDTSANKSMGFDSSATQSFLLVYFPPMIEAIFFGEQYCLHFQIVFSFEVDLYFLVAFIL